MKDHALQLARTARPGQGRNVLREYLQARILETLQRLGATRLLALCGGTALRFLFLMPRYSEDLDFALESDRDAYDLEGWLTAVARQFLSEGYEAESVLRDQSVVHAAWLRFPGLVYEARLSPHPTEKLAIKMEVDTNPPAGAVTETRTIQRHVAIRLRHHDRASLLAGKLAAILARPYAKGRDVYDLWWYIADPRWPAPNLRLLNSALRQTKPEAPPLTGETWRLAVARRVEEMPWDRVRADVLPFLEGPQTLPTREELLALLRSV